jgi:hypothetical protein
MDAVVEGSTTAVGAGRSDNSPGSFLLQPMIASGSAAARTNTTSRVFKTEYSLSLKTIF